MPDGPITVVLWGEPAGKGRPRFRVITPRNGKPFASVYTPAETRAYEGALKMAGKVAMKGRKPLDGPLAVTVTAVMAVPQSWSRKKRDAALAGIVRPTGKPDGDNFLKAACDSLNGVCYLDDSQLVDMRVVKLYGERPAMQVEVRPLEPFGD